MNFEVKLHTSLNPFFFFCFLSYIGVQLNNNVGSFQLHNRDSVIHAPLSILFQILSSIRLLQNIEQSSQWSTVGPC